MYYKLSLEQGNLIKDNINMVLQADPPLRSNLYSALRTIIDILDFNYPVVDGRITTTKEYQDEKSQAGTTAPPTAPKP